MAVLYTEAVDFSTRMHSKVAHQMHTNMKVISNPELRGKHVNAKGHFLPTSERMTRVQCKGEYALTLNCIKQRGYPQVIQYSAKMGILGCVNLPPRPEGARTREHAT